MSVFTGTLLTEWLPDGKSWRVVKTFEFHSGAPGTGLFVRVEEGFITDLASIPFGVRWLIPKTGRHAQAAVIHDAMYRDGSMLIRVNGFESESPISRAMADSMMYQAMKALNVVAWRRELIYRGLQVGGWVAWNRHRERGNGMATETTT